MAPTPCLVDQLRTQLREHRINNYLRQMDYELQRDGNQMLVLQSQ